jgi:hypothetical protein
LRTILLVPTTVPSASMIMLSEGKTGAKLAVAELTSKNPVTSEKKSTEISVSANAVLFM